MLQTIEEVTTAADHNLNPRRLDNAVNGVKIKTRVQSILDKGLIDPLVINKQTGRMVKGHIRAAAIRVIHDTMPEAYAEHFSKGIPVNEVDLTDAEEEIARNDHGETEGLESLEVYFSAKALYNAGLKYTKVIIQLASLFFSASSSTKKAELAEKLEKGDQSAQGQRDIIVAHHKGTAQRYQRLAYLPQCVEDVWVANRDGSSADFRIRDADIQALGKAFKKDAELDPAANREIPGTLFREAWAKAVKAGLKRIKDGGARDSTKWTPTTIRNHAEACPSLDLKGILFQCINDEKLSNATNIVAVGSLLFKIETIAKHDPDTYAELMSALNEAYEAIKADVNEAKDAAISA